MKEDEKGRGLERGTHRGHVSSEFPFALRACPLEESAPFLHSVRLWRPQRARTGR